MEIINTINKCRVLVVVGALLVFFLAGGFAYASGDGDHATHDTSAAVSGEHVTHEAAAEEHAGGHGGHDSAAALTDLLYRAICFTILVIVLVVVVKKTPIKDFFSNRREDIKNRFEDLNSKKELAEKRFQELEQKLKDFEASRQEIIDQYKADGAAERDKIIAEAEKRALQIQEQTDLTIQREIKAAGDRLKQELMDSAAKNAQAIIAEKMKDSDQDHLVDEFIKSVEKLH